MDQGALHETFNMASLWKLPVIYIVENNLMSMGTQLHRHSWTTELTVRGGPAYGMPGVLVDANEIEEMARVTREACNRARKGEGPTFIEAKTYRFRGHSMSDPMKYRSKEEADKAKERDPIVLYESLLRDRGWIDQEKIEKLHDEVKAEIEAAIEFAENAPEPTADELYQDITVAPHIPQES
jgi:pyruvate dehydrogenase E1 component alpha subunit